MHDPVVAVASLTAERERAIPFVEPRAPGDQFGDASGGLANDGIDHVLVAQAAAGGERVGDMVVEAVLRIDDAGDASLGPLTRRALQVVFRDHRHRQPLVNRERRPQAGETTPEDEHVGEAVRHPLGAKRHQVARSFVGLAHSADVPCMNALNCSR
jgi:hypothetical protein